MTDIADNQHGQPRARRIEPQPARGCSATSTGLGFAIVLTLASFWAAGTDPGVGPGRAGPAGGAGDRPDGRARGVLLPPLERARQHQQLPGAGFGVFVVGLVVFGSMLIMANLDANMMASPPPMNMQP